jgi:hypothetical protein
MSELSQLAQALEGMGMGMGAQDRALRFHCPRCDSKNWIVVDADTRRCGTCHFIHLLRGDHEPDQPAWLPPPSKTDAQISAEAAKAKRARVRQLVIAMLPCSAYANATCTQMVMTAIELDKEIEEISSRKE